MLLAVVLVLGICPVPAQARQHGNTADPTNDIISAPDPWETVAESNDAEIPASPVFVAYENGSVAATVKAGDLTWTFYNNGLLKISGTGEMGGCDYDTWHTYRDRITSVIIEDGITSIHDQAFWYCTSLVSVSIPDSVTYIGEYAFAVCSSLVSVNIPDSVTYIGDGAFSDCRSLTSVNIPDSVTSINAALFYDCSSLTSVAIPDSVTSINNYSFYNCSSLTSVTIPDSVTYIGCFAFDGCSSLASVNIPDSVTYIDQYAFQGCTSLTSVTIPDGVEFIAFGTFGACSSLTSVSIPDTVTGIYKDAFVGCSSLASITIPNSVTAIGKSAFQNCTSLTSVIIPERVTSIGSLAFCGCTSLASVTIPNSVTEIQESAFDSCPSLKDIYYNGTPAQWNNIAIDPDNETLLEANINYATINHDDIAQSGKCGADGANVTWTLYTSGLLKISGNGAMEEYSEDGKMPPWQDFAEDIVWLEIDQGVTSISDYSFQNCTALFSVTMADSVVSIGSHAFESCSDLTELTLGSSVTIIDDYAFCGCSTLTSIALPDSVTAIGNYAFSGCSGLTSIAIPDSVTAIGPYAFKNCSGLTHIAIGSGITDLNNSLSYEYPNLTAYAVSEDNPRYFTDRKGVLYDREQQELIAAPRKISGFLRIPDGITVISSSAFRDCTGLTCVSIPDGATTIGTSAFYCCSNLTSLYIPSSMATVGNYVLGQCSSLTDIYYGGTQAEWNLDRLANSYSVNCTVHFNCTADAVPDDNDLVDCGTCGAADESVSWTLLGSGLLKIYGSGAMKDYSPSDAAPWHAVCDMVRQVEIVNGVTAIGNYAFMDCTGITSLTMAGSVCAIGDDAFHSCSSLKDVYYDDTQEAWAQIQIGSRNAPLTSAVLHPGGETHNPEDGELVDSGEFVSATHHTKWVLYDSGILRISGYGVMEDFDEEMLPAWHDYSSQITQVTIGDQITSIGSYAFYDCTSLTGVTIPDSVTHIGRYAFYGCTSLTGLTIPDSVTHIDRAAFCDCTSLTSVIIPDSVISLGDYAFCGCTSLTDITISCALTTLPSAVFDSCTSLTSVIIPVGIDTIESDAFCYCRSLTSVIIPDTVRKIKWWAFQSCDNLADVYYGGSKHDWDSISINVNNSELFRARLHCFSIGDYQPVDRDIVASGECGDQGGNVTWRLYRNGYLRISGNGGIIDTFLDLENDELEGPWVDAFRIKHISIEDGVTSIGERAFSGHGVISVSLADSVSSIGKFAFSSCSYLNRAVIPATVTEIGMGAFFDCGSLEEVYYGGTEDQWSDIEIGELNDCLYDATIHFGYSPEEPEPDVLYGDCNGDGKVNGMDLILLRQYLADWDVSCDLAAADTNGNGNVNGLDLILLRQYLAGWSVTLGSQ